MKKKKKKIELRKVIHSTQNLKNIKREKAA